MDKLPYIVFNEYLLAKNEIIPLNNLEKWEDFITKYVDVNRKREDIILKYIDALLLLDNFTCNESEYFSFIVFCVNKIKDIISNSINYDLCKAEYITMLENNISINEEDNTIILSDFIDTIINRNTQCSLVTNEYILLFISLFALNNLNRKCALFIINNTIKKIYLHIASLIKNNPTSILLVYKKTI